MPKHATPDRREQIHQTVTLVILARKERLGTLLSKTASPNNLRLITTQTKGKSTRRNVQLNKFAFGTP